MSRIQIPWKELALAAASLILFFGVLEGILLVAGVEPPEPGEDPFVEISAKSPLFVPLLDESGVELLVTAPKNRILFNEQRFPRVKARGTFRIFCLGGSTTYGRPFSDSTSFAGWLRELLPMADSSRNWEVINAGGISYASYRVAAVMQELAAYEPDLFIVYTGHNEFLEERTYSSTRRMPKPLRSTAAILSRTRTWTASRNLLRTAGLSTTRGRDRYRLPDEVTAKLDKSAGLELYERDDVLRDQVVQHFRTSLERMAQIAREAEAGLIFVTPASNLRSFTPFKSQHSDNLSESDRKLSDSLLDRTREQLKQARWEVALETIDQTLELDRRFADAHFLRGRALFELGRTAEAKHAFEQARDEDVCPLRAISPLTKALKEIARDTNTPLVDFVGLLESFLAEKTGHTILGEESFLDHVHPTIEGHRLLALSLLEELTREGLVDPGPDWGESAVQQAIERVEGKIDPADQARALAQLAWTLDWAGKEEASRRLALQALGYGLEDPTILLIAARHRAFQGHFNEARELFLRALRADPMSPTSYYQYGLFLIDQRELEAAAAHFLRARTLWPADSRAHLKFGLVMAEQRRFQIALPALEEAERRNPGDRESASAIAKVKEMLGSAALQILPQEVEVEAYASGSPRWIVQTTSDRQGRAIRHGVWTEWFETGELSSYANYLGGKLASPVLRWEQGGTLRPTQSPPV